MENSLQQIIAVVLLQAGMIVFPGSDWFLVLRHSSQEGSRNGSLVAIGLGLGSLLVVILAIFGLSVFFDYFPSAAKVIRYLGAAWLIWQAVICFFPHVAKSGGNKTQTISPLLAGFINHTVNIEMVFFYIAVISQLGSNGVDLSFQLAVALEMGLFTALWFIFIAQASQKVMIIEKVLAQPLARIIIGILFLVSAFTLIKT